MSVSLLGACSPTTFTPPSVFGAEILSVEASLVTNYSATAPDLYRFTQPSTQLHNATFCNVTVSYTHPGQNDKVITEAWLPVDNWNGRFQAVGGGGWVAGRFFLSYSAMNGALADGYATITTDAGLGASLDAGPWALRSPGNVDLALLQNLASVSLNDEAIIGKSLIKSFYGKGPEFSYWNGCSQGGRQGLMLAQRYPTAYDGIAAGAPAIYWTELFSYLQWPQQVMNMLGAYPYGCELDAITAASVTACDGLDGVVDGVIADIAACKALFDPFSLVGTVVNCSEADGEVQVSREAAAVANSTWNGMVTASGKRTWYGINPGADLTGNSPASYQQPGLAATNCTGGTCLGSPNSLGLQWLQLIVARDADLDFTNLTHAEFDRLVHLGGQMYSSVISADDPDLSAFREAGGKLVSFHGLSDNIIPPEGTERYYNAVASVTPDIDGFFRHYEVPGLGHCWGGRGGQPTTLFAQLRAWVENGTAPETSPRQITDLEGKTQNRVLCPYPQTARLDARCGNSSLAACWSCVDASKGRGGCARGGL